METKKANIEILTDQYDKVLAWVQSLVPYEDAEDVTQDIYLNIVTSIDSFESRSDLNTWLYRVVHNRVKDYHRTQYRRGRYWKNGVNLKKYPAKTTYDIIEMRDLIDKVPKIWREVVWEHFVLGMGHAERADASGETYEAVRSRYKRAMKWLKSSNLLD